MDEDATGRIVGMMAVTAVFGVVGAEIRQAQSTPQTGSVNGFIADPFLVVFGATVATAILVGLASFAGTPGKKLGVGLAGLSVLTVTLVDGGPVWKELAKLFSKPVLSSTKTTGRTQGPTGTSGVDTYGGGHTPGPVYQKG